MLTNFQMEKVRQFNDRRKQHYANAIKLNPSKRKPRIFPLKGPKSEETKRKVDGYIATGIFNGQHISVPGFPTSWDAHNYGARKGWRKIAVVTSMH